MIRSNAIWWRSALLAASIAFVAPVHGQPAPAAAEERFKAMSRDAEAKGLAEPFKGVTTDGKVVAGLFPVRCTGVSTEPERKAAAAFLAALSAKGLKLSRDVMRLNETLAEMKNNWKEYGEGRYFLTVMGTPSEKGPWGFQLDGHHLIINYFVLGDQVVMTPAFWGSEPVVARSGKYRGTAILQEEQDKGLALINALPEAQRKKAVIEVSKTGNNNVGEAFKDNVVLAYAGVKASELPEKQREQLLELVALYVNNMDDGHAKVKMEDVRRHLADTHFAWVGDTKPDSVFYYRVHSPVILIEFDHQKPIALGDRGGPPTRDHVHVLVRTPNGNDYGKDLLRQHYKDHPHPHGH